MRAMRYVLAIAAVLVLVTSTTSSGSIAQADRASMPPGCNMSYNYGPAFGGQVFAATLPDGARLSLSFHRDNHVFWVESRPGEWRTGTAYVTDHLNVPGDLYIEWSADRSFRLIPTDCEKQTQTISAGNLIVSGATTVAKSIRHACGIYWTDYKQNQNWVGYQYFPQGTSASIIRIKVLGRSMIEILLGYPPPIYAWSRVLFETVYDPRQRPDPRRDRAIIQWNPGAGLWESTDVICRHDNPAPVAVYGTAFDKQRKYLLVDSPTPPNPPSRYE